MPGPSKKKGQKAKQQRAAATAAAAAAAPPSVVNDFELPAREWLEKKMRDAGVGPETMTDEERAAFEAKVAQLEAEQEAAEESADSRSAWYQRHEAASSNKQQKNTISIGEYDPVEACAALPPEKRTAWTEAYLEGKVLFIVACFPYSALRKKHRALTTRYFLRPPLSSASIPRRFPPPSPAIQPPSSCRRRGRRRRGRRTAPGKPTPQRRPSTSASTTCTPAAPWSRPCCC